MNKLLLALTLAVPAALMTGCLQDEKTNNVETATKVGKINNSDPYKPDYKGSAVDLKDPYLTGKNPVIPSYNELRSMDSAGTKFYASGLSKEAIAGSWVGVIPWNLSSCPVADRVNIYMDDEDGGNTSSFTSLFTPNPAGLDDGNPGNTRMIMCKVAGGNFRRLKTVNYAVFNFGDGNQSCVNGGYNYTQTIDNEDSGNNSDWTGCCGNNDPDYWTHSGSWTGYMRIRVCYYPADNANPVELTFPNMIGRDYGVFTEPGQDNKYVKSWGSVRSDDEDNSRFNGNYQIFTGDPTGNATFFNSSILDWGADDDLAGTFTRWNYGKIKQYVP